MTVTGVRVSRLLAYRRCSTTETLLSSIAPRGLLRRQTRAPGRGGTDLAGWYSLRVSSLRRSYAVLTINNACIHRDIFHDDSVKPVLMTIPCVAVFYVRDRYALWRINHAASMPAKYSTHLRQKLTRLLRTTRLAVLFVGGDAAAMLTSP